MLRILNVAKRMSSALNLTVASGPQKMSRRDFLVRTGLISGAAAITSSTISCGKSEEELAIDASLDFIKTLDSQDPISLFHKYSKDNLDVGTNKYRKMILHRTMLAIAGQEATNRFLELEDLDTGAHTTDAALQIKASLAIAGREAIDRFKFGHFDTGVEDKDATAQVRANLAIAGQEAVARFLLLKDLDLGVEDKDAAAQIRASLAIAGQEAVARFVELSKFQHKEGAFLSRTLNTGADSDKTDAQIRLELAIAGQEAIDRFVELKDLDVRITNKDDEYRNVIAQVKTGLAIAGQEAIDRFDNLNSPVWKEYYRKSSELLLLAKAMLASKSPSLFQDKKNTGSNWSITGAASNVLYMRNPASPMNMMTSFF